MEHRTKKNHPPHELISEYESRLDHGDRIFLAERDFYQLIQYYEDADEIDRALEVADHAISLHSYCVEFLTIKARLLLSANEPLRAIRYLEQAEVISPYELDVHLLRARALSDLGHYNTAVLFLDAARKFAVGSDRIEIGMCTAHLYERMKQYDRMYEELVKVLHLDPLHTEALERIWWSVENTKKFGDAIALYHELLDIDAYSYLAWYNLGHAYACIQEYSKAIEAMEYAFLIDPDFDMAYMDCAELCIQEQRYGQAMAIYREMIARFGADSEELVKLAECEFYTDRISDCKRTLVEAIKLDSYNDEAYYFLGKCFSALGKYDNATASLLKAISIENRREEYFAELASVYAMAGNPGKADFYFRKATEIGPEQDTFWCMHVRFLIALGQHEKALDIIEEAEYQTFSAELMYCRAICLMMLNRRAKAIDVLREALIECVDGHVILYDLCPDLRHDAEITSMVRYYQGEHVGTV